MKTHFHRTSFLILCALAAHPVAAAGGATLSVLYNVTAQNLAPTAVLEGSPGTFYATGGNAYNVFCVTNSGSGITLASFGTPYIVESNPGSVGPNGLLYSSVERTTMTGGLATVFSVSCAAGSEKLHGTGDLAPSVAGNLPNGELFGLVYDFSNALNNLGTVSLTGKVATFYQFAATDRPGTPIYGADGNYYGVSGQGITGATSYFYRVTPAGTFSQVASFPFLSGGGFYGDGFVLQASDGNFYGIQQTGAGCAGANQHGAVYKLTPAGQFTILHDFGVCANAIVNPLIEGSDGKLYGAIEGSSVLFSLTKSGVYKQVAALNGTYGLCPCGLLQGSDGMIYGAAAGGGSIGAGTIFALNAGLPVPKPRAPAFYPKSGAVGTQVRIWGYNLFGASVEFNGTAATGIYNNGPNYVWATVPTGATTGPITVTTAGGTVTTKASFTVQ